MKSIYEPMCLEIIEFGGEDIITTSGITVKLTPNATPVDKDPWG